MGYINAFSGGTVQSSNTSYSLISTQLGNIILAWPSEFQNTQNVVYDFMNITSGGVAATNITLPDARKATVGVSFVFNNVGANAIQIRNNDATNLQNIASGAVYEFYLTDNSTQNGLWSIIPFGGGAGGVTTFTSVQPASGFTVIQNQNTGAIVQTFTLIGDLASITSLAGNTGYGVRTAANTWATRSLVQGANIAITNPAGIAGNSTIALNNALVGLTSIAVGNLNLSNNIILGTQANQNIVITPNGTGELQSTNNINIQSQNLLKFYNAANTFYTAFQSQNPVANTTYQWPTVFPTANNQTLASTTAGVMSWVNAVTSPGATTTNAIAKYLNVTGQLANSGVLIDAGNNITGAVSATIQNIAIGTVAAVPTSGTNTISAVNAGGGIALIPNGAGEVVVRGPLTLSPVAAVPQGVFFDDGAAANFVGLQAQTAAMAASVTYTLPNAGPTILGQHLTATVPAVGASTMSWANPAVLQAVRTASAVAINTNTIIPLDNTIPQIGEGTEAITVTITPRSNGIIRLEFYCPLVNINGAGKYAIFALFQDANANALAVTSTYIDTAQSPNDIELVYFFTPAVPNIATTFRIRYGTNDGTQIYLLSAATTNNNFGGIPQMSLMATEIAP